MPLRRLLSRRRRLASSVGELIGVTGHSMPADFVIVPSLRIASVDVQNLPIAFADVHTFKRFGMDDRPAVLLGMDVLRTFERVAIDFGRRKIRFRMLSEGRAGTAYAWSPLPAAM